MIWVLVMVALVAVIAFWQRHRSRRADVSWRPPELRGAQAVLAERMFRTSTPFPLVAKVDRGFSVGGEIVLVELKTRRPPKAYPSDIIELSAQKLAIEGETGAAVKPFAYVVTQHPNTAERRHHRVRLLGAHELARLERRRTEILAGHTEPRIADNEGLCRKCVFVGRCRPELLGIDGRQ